jgi:hypothetical protein
LLLHLMGYERSGLVEADDQAKLSARVVQRFSWPSTFFVCRKNGVAARHWIYPAASVAAFEPMHGNRADAGLELALGYMLIAHDMAPTVRVVHLGVRGEECLDHRRQHESRASPQHQWRWVVGDTRLWPHQTNNGIPLDRAAFWASSTNTKKTPPRPSSARFEHSSRQDPLPCTGTGGCRSWPVVARPEAGRIANSRSRKSRLADEPRRVRGGVGPC